MPLAFPAPALGWTDEIDEQYAQSPIDPTGAVAFAIDPAILNEENDGVEYAQGPSQHQFQQSSFGEHYPPDHDVRSQQDHYTRDFPQGPPPDPELLLQLPQDDEDQPPPPKAHQKKVRRVKRPRREKNCGFCLGNDERNKEGVPETMLSCFNCGRSGHPTCLDIAGIAETVFNYRWTCIDCKACEICHDKGDDTKLLFCDNCDRGWHYDCLEYPLDGPPEGNWNCPLCPPLPEEEEYNCEGEGEADEGEVEASGGEAEDDATALTESEAITQVMSTPRPKKKKKTKSKSRPSRTPSSNRKTWLPQRGPGRPLGSGGGSSAVPSSQRVTFRLRLGSSRSAKGVVDDEKTTPFESFLSPEEFDTSKTIITVEDKNRFEKSRVVAENKTLARTMQASLPETPSSSSTLPPSSSLRPLRSLTHLIPTPTPALAESPAPSTPGPSGSNDSTGQLRIRTLRFGEWDIDTWYDAPFPEEYNNLPEGRLWMCEFCLRYMRSGFGWERHQTKCKARHPPGDEIYRDGDISVFEVDGRKNKIYCQNLCLLSKMFLDHKSLFYDVEPFLFYVMAEIDDGGAHFVGYFSKEKRSPKDFNVSCIMTLPVRQRKGWGNLLINFSYLLSKKEQRVGSPERPLSALGALSYRNYWTLAIMNYLQTSPEDVTFESISVATSMTIADIVGILREQNMLVADERPHSPLPRSPAGFKGGKNKHNRPRPRSQLFSNRRNSSRKATSAKDDNNSEPRIPSPGSYSIQWDRAEVEAYLARWRAKGYPTLKPNRLKWSPYLLTRGGPMLKSDTTPSQVGSASNMVNSTPKPFPDDAELKAASEVGISAVDQVASTGHAEAGPSSARANSLSTSKHSPRVTIDADVGNDQDSTFEPDEEEIQETPTRTRSRSTSHQRPTRVSLRQLTSRTGSLTSDARSSVTSDRRRTHAQDREHRQNDDPPIMNGQSLTAADHCEKRLINRHGRSSENLRSPRKRPRIASSPESSLLSEPPSSHAHNTSSPPTEDEDDDKTLSSAPHHLISERDDGFRRTRSFSSQRNSNKRMPARRISLRLNGNGNGNEHENHSYDTPFFDNPEEALRNAKKARLNQAINLHATSISPAELSMTNGVNGTTNGNAILVTTVPVHLNVELDESDLLDADAEGEVEEAIGLPIDPSDEGDVDAEGEVEDADGEADAEGEIEMELY